MGATLRSEMKKRAAKKGRVFRILPPERAQAGLALWLDFTAESFDRQHALEDAEILRFYNARGVPRLLERFASNAEEVVEYVVAACGGRFCLFVGRSSRRGVYRGFSRGHLASFI